MQSTKQTKKGGKPTKPTVTKPRITPKMVKTTLKEFEERYSELREKVKNVSDVDNPNVEVVRKLGRYISLYAQLKNVKETDESIKAGSELIRKAHAIVKEAQKDPNWQGEKVYTQTRFAEHAFARKATIYLSKVFNNMDDAEVGEDGKYASSVFTVGSGEPAEPAPAQEEPAPAPEQTPTQTAEQTAATMAGEGAGALPPMPPQQQATADGVPAGSASNDAAEDDVGVPVATATATPASAPAGEATASDSATATNVKTADGKSEGIGAAGDGASMGQADIQQAQFAASIQDTTAGVGGRGTKREGGEPEEPPAQAYQNLEGGDDVDTTQLQAMLRREYAQIEASMAERLNQVRNAFAAMQNDEEANATRAAFDANVERIMNQAREDARRRAAEGQAANVQVDFDDINQRVGEQFNQLVQEVGVSIPNAAERAAFIASMERGEREDVREEARQAQVPEEALKQQRAARVQRAAELREAQNVPPEIPAPVDVDIDIASLNLGDAGSVPSTQMLGDAMMQDKAKESMERKHRDSLSVQQLKQEIEALHSVYDALIADFKRPEHQRQKQAAMASGRPEALRQHLENMMASVRRYYTQGGMRVGVIISREAFMGMGGQASGMSVPATSQRSGIEVTKHGTSKFRPQVRNESVMRGGINTKKTLDNYIPKQDPQTRRPQRPHAQLTRFDHPHPSVELPRRTRPYDGVVLKTKSK